MSPRLILPTAVAVLVGLAAAPAAAQVTLLHSFTGGSADGATDPWVSTGGDGTVYFSGAAISSSSDPPPAVLV